MGQGRGWGGGGRRYPVWVREVGTLEKEDDGKGRESRLRGRGARWGRVEGGGRREKMLNVGEKKIR